jgi:16S rRNA (guanine(527)-N(7))-methyltransferase RsmG
VTSDVSRETAARLADLAALIRSWNPRVNLVSPKDLDRLEQRHLADSLQLADLVPPGATPLMDLGSGGGLPGLVLALTLRRPIHLVEADRRKAAFLATAASTLGLEHVTVHADRIEALRPKVAPGVLTARALARLPELLAFAEPLLASDGVALFPKGRQAEAELTDAARSWTFRLERFQSRTDPDGCILRLFDIRRADR